MIFQSVCIHCDAVDSPHLQLLAIARVCAMEHIRVIRVSSIVAHNLADSHGHISKFATLARLYLLSTRAHYKSNRLVRKKIVTAFVGGVDFLHGRSSRTLQQSS